MFFGGRTVLMRRVSALGFLMLALIFKSRVYLKNREVSGVGAGEG